MLTYLTIGSTSTYGTSVLLTARLSDTGDYFASLLTRSSGITYCHIRLTYTGMFPTFPLLHRYRYLPGYFRF